MGAGNVAGRLHGLGQFFLILREPEALLAKCTEPFRGHIQRSSDRLSSLHNSRSGTRRHVRCGLQCPGELVADNAGKCEKRSLRLVDVAARKGGRLFHGVGHIVQLITAEPRGLSGGLEDSSQLGLLFFCVASLGDEGGKHSAR
ncbi:hypothetical protein D3C71_1227430 [compost metagenome]